MDDASLPHGRGTRRVEKLVTEIENRGHQLGLRRIKVSIVPLLTMLDKGARRFWSAISAGGLTSLVSHTASDM